MSQHTQAQGLRVHHLANLGGLIALAGLDQEPPDFLLGALLSMACEREQLSIEQRASIASLGRAKLNERASAKRAWKSWQRSKHLHSVTMTTAQMVRLIKALGGCGAGGPDDLMETLTTLLNGEKDAPAEEASR